MSVEIVFGNILDAGINDVTAILHQVNCKGVMGAGLAKGEGEDRARAHSSPLPLDR